MVSTLKVVSTTYGQNFLKRQYGFILFKKFVELPFGAQKGRVSCYYK